MNMSFKSDLIADVRLVVLPLILAVPLLQGCGGGGESSEASPPPSIPNQSPVASAGDDQAVDELVEVTLSAQDSRDSDGSIASYRWSQISPSSPQVSIQNADSATATFEAPEVAEDTVLEFELRVEDDDGGVSTDRVRVQVTNVELRILDVSPGFGWHGDSVNVKTRGLGSATQGDVEVLLGGEPVAPTSLDSGTVAFVIPDGAVGRGLHVRVRGRLSNGVPFAIRESGLVAPDADDFTVDGNGMRVVTSYVIVRLNEDHADMETAEQIAKSMNGEVIGTFDFMDWWQISVPNKPSIEELSRIVETIASMPEVTNAFLDYDAFTSDAIDWTGDPDSGVRELNNVEAGADLYERHVGHEATGNVTPFFMNIAVSELTPSIDFEVDDFITRPEPRADIYAEEQEDGLDEAHATNVLGVIAAELVADANAEGENRPGNAGLVRALQDSHGGANISVEGVTILSLSLESIHDEISKIGRGGVGAINWSWGHFLVSSEASDCAGNTSGEDAGRKWHRDDGTYKFQNARNELSNFLQNVSREYPNTVFVQSAGNDRMNVDFTVRRGSGDEAANNHIVVGAHSVDSEHEEASNSCFADQEDTRVKRARYSNFGNRVDIAAGGTHFLSKCAPDKEGCKGNGTSYSAPLVTATVALMQSINPNLSAGEIKSMLRQSASPIDANEVQLHDGDTANFVRPLTANESSSHQGKGAMLNVEGAIQAALDSLGEDEGRFPVPISRAKRVRLLSATEEVKEIIEVAIPDRQGTAFNRADIMFLVDVTGSYRDDIQTFRRQAEAIRRESQSLGADVHIGLASFSTIPRYPWGCSKDYPYRLDLPLVERGLGLAEALRELRIVTSGGGQRESQLDALFAVADDDDAGWRQGSLRLVFLATDEAFTDKDKEPSYPGRGYMETLAKLIEQRVQVWGLTSGGSLDDVGRLANDTSGRQIPLSRDSSEIVEAITEAVTVESSDLSVRLVPYGDFFRLVRKIRPLDEPNASECVLENTNPLDCDARKGVSPGDRVRFEVTLQGNGALIGTRRLSFRLQVDANKGAVVMEIPVTVEVSLSS